MTAEHQKRRLPEAAARVRNDGLAPWRGFTKVLLGLSVIDILVHIMYLYSKTIFFSSQLHIDDMGVLQILKCHGSLLICRNMDVFHLYCSTIEDLLRTSYAFKKIVWY